MNVIQDKNWKDLSWVLFGVSVSIPSFFLGDKFLKSGSLLEVSLSLITAAIAWSFLAILSGGWERRFKATTYELIKLNFPNLFGKITNSLLVLMTCLWFAINIEIFISLIEKDLLSTSLMKNLIIISSGTFMTVSSYLGLNGLKRLSQLFLPIFLLIFISVTWKSELPDLELDLYRFNWHKFYGLLFTSLPILIIGAFMFPDLARFAKKPSDLVIASVLGFGIMAPAFLIFCSYLSPLWQEAGVLAFLNQSVEMYLLVFFLFLATWTTNDNNLYSSSLALSEVFNIKRKPAALLMGVLGTCLALIGITENLTKLFSLMTFFTLITFSYLVITIQFSNKFKK